MNSQAQTVSVVMPGQAQTGGGGMPEVGAEINEVGAA